MTVARPSLGAPVSEVGWQAVNRPLKLTPGRHGLHLCQCRPTWTHLSPAPRCRASAHLNNNLKLLGARILSLAYPLGLRVRVVHEALHFSSVRMARSLLVVLDFVDHDHRNSRRERNAADYTPDKPLVAALRARKTGAGAASHARCRLHAACEASTLLLREPLPPPPHPSARRETRSRSGPHGGDDSPL